MTNSGFSRGLHSRQDIAETHLSAERALQTITKRRKHDPNGLLLLGEYHFLSSTCVICVPGKIVWVAEAIAAIRAASISAFLSGKTDMMIRIIKAKKARITKTIKKATRQMTTNSAECMNYSLLQTEIGSLDGFFSKP
jgi:hypothetical protein